MTVIPEKANQYKNQHRQPQEEEMGPYRSKSSTASKSNSKKRSDHKHSYKRIILHYGSDCFAWGRQCEICGRIDSSYKASWCSPAELKPTGRGSGGTWSEICLGEIHGKFPEYTIMTLGNARWKEWTYRKEPL